MCAHEKKKNALFMLSARCLKPLVCGCCTTNVSSPPCPVPSPLFHCICSMCVGLCVTTHGLCWPRIKSLKHTKTFPYHLTQIAKLVQMAYGQVSCWLQRKPSHRCTWSFFIYAIITYVIKANESSISLLHVPPNMSKLIKSNQLPSYPAHPCKVLLKQFLYKKWFLHVIFSQISVR